MLLSVNIHLSLYSLTPLSCLCFSSHLLPLWASFLIISDLYFPTLQSSPFYKTQTLYLKLCTVCTVCLHCLPSLSLAGSSSDPYILFTVLTPHCNTLTATSFGAVLISTVRFCYHCHEFSIMWERHIITELPFNLCFSKRNEIDLVWIDSINLPLSNLSKEEGASIVGV